MGIKWESPLQLPHSYNLEGNSPTLRAEHSRLRRLPLVGVRILSGAFMYKKGLSRISVIRSFLLYERDDPGRGATGVFEGSINN